MEYDKSKDQVRLMRNCIEFIGKEILEIGCGNGTISILLAKGAKTYTAVDPDPDAIAQARQHDSPVTFRTGSGQALDFPDHHFDLVLFTLSLHHQESAPALAEAFRVLKPGGHALVVEPNAEGEFQQFFNLFNDETEALEAAMAAVKTGPFTLLEKDHLELAVSFENTRDLCDYDFHQDRTAPENGEKILDLLCRLKGLDSPADIPDAPIDLVDRLRLFLLLK